MDNFISYIALGASIMTLAVSIFIIRLWKKTEKAEKTRVNISGQRERIENLHYSLNETFLSDIDNLYDSNRLVLEFPEKDLSINTKTPNYSFFENLGIDMSNIQIMPKTAFCLMPFNKRFNWIHDSIRTSCIEAGFDYFRSDEPFNPGNILRQILQMMASAEIIIAVLDGKNPNVFYEIGIAHSLGKTVILVGNAKTPDDISFDLKSERLLLYYSPSDLQEKLTQILKNLHYV